MSFRDPTTSKGQVERLARLYYRKFHSTLGASLTVDDLTQEFWLVWHAVVQKFDPSKGFDFKAFLGVSLRNKALELSRSTRRRNPLFSVSLDAPASDETSSSIVDLIEDESLESAEDRLIKRETRERVDREIDPRLAKMIEFLEKTPEALERQVEALNAKAAHAASLGLSMQAPKTVTLTMLSEIMGVSRCVRYRLIEDMKEILSDD